MLIYNKIESSVNFMEKENFAYLTIIIAGHDSWKNKAQFRSSLLLSDH